MKITWLIAVACYVCNPTSWLIFPTRATAMEEKSVRKDDLQVIVNQFPLSATVRRNASGDIQRIDGVSPLVLDWISVRYKFDYTLVMGTSTTVEDVGSKPGHITSMLKLKADVMITAMSYSPGRLQYIEFVHPWIFSPGAFLLPKPEGWQNNVDAVIKPFQPWVWLALVIAAMAITSTLMYFNFLAKMKDKFIQTREKHQKAQLVGITQDPVMYIIATLLNQGGYIPCKITKIRLVVGAWCLLTLVLVNVYNGILISFVTTVRPNLPIIESEADVGYDPNIRLVVNKGLAGDVWFTLADKGLYKAYGDKLRTYSKSRCNSTAVCIELVKSLPHHHVYFNSMHALREVLLQDYQKVKECKLTMLTNQAFIPACWGLPKKSPYLEKFNRGTLRLHEIGLISFWEGVFQADTRPCWNRKHNQIVNNHDEKPLVRLSLDNLVGAFAVLIVGALLSLVVFIMENIFSHWKNKILLMVPIENRHKGIVV